jgi:hypothetical protein
MQILIANATVNFTDMKGMPPDFLDSLVASGSLNGGPQGKKLVIPKIRESFPGLDALYAGIAPAEDGLPQAHLVLWHARPDGRMPWKESMEWAANVNPETNSHAPSKVESALVYATLRDVGFTEEDREWWHWTSTRNGDKAAFCQYFYNGYQSDSNLYGSYLVRAVSRLPL